MIDDDPKILDTIALVLGEHNEVVTTTSAREALRRFEAGERFDAVFCDLMMPDMNGMELHAELSERLPEVADGLTFLTGGAVTASARAFLERVPNRCVTKPFTLSELEQVIAERAGG